MKINKEVDLIVNYYAKKGDEKSLKLALIGLIKKSKKNEN